MSEWDDERPSVTGREIASNIPGKVSRLSARERRLLIGAAIIGPAILVLIILLVKLF